MNLQRATALLLFSQVQGRTHPADDPAKSLSPHKPDDELIEDDAAAAALIEDDDGQKLNQASASAPAEVRRRDYGKEVRPIHSEGVGVETIDVGVLMSSSSGRHRRRQMKDGKRTSTLSSSTHGKNRRLQSVCDATACTFDLDSTIERNFDELSAYEFSEFFEIEAPPGTIEINMCNSGLGYLYLYMEFLGLFESFKCPFNCDPVPVTSLTLDVATTLTLYVNGYDFGYGNGVFKLMNSFTASPTKEPTRQPTSTSKASTSKSRRRDAKAAKKTKNKLESESVYHHQQQHIGG